MSNTAVLISKLLFLRIQIGLGLLRCIHGMDHIVIDVIPVDLTANAIVAAAWYTAANR